MIIPRFSYYQTNELEVFIDYFDIETIKRNDEEILVMYKFRNDIMFIDRDIKNTDDRIRFELWINRCQKLIEINLSLKFYGYDVEGIQFERINNTN